MNCPECSKTIENEACFCTDCGRPLVEELKSRTRRQRKVYFIALLFVVIIVRAAAICY